MALPDFLSQGLEAIRPFLTLDAADPFKTGSKLFAMAAGSVAVGTTLATKTYPWLRAKLDRRSIEKRIGAELYTAAIIERAVRHYVPPRCQDLDPAGGEEPRLVYGVRQKLFDALDDALVHATE